MAEEGPDQGLQGGVPLLARISGLPADSMAAFTSGLCAGEVARLHEVRAELARARAELVDRLHAAIPDAPPPLRRALLAVKRDAFNGRGLDRHRGAACWEELRRLSDVSMDSVERLEAELTFQTARLEAAYSQTLESERRWLLSLFEDPAFLRGVALASPVLVDSLRRHRDLAALGRDARLEGSLLRYASRAALKLSPYSTLTPTALGEIRDDLPAGGPRLLGQRWSQRSLVRLKRYSLSQITEVLQRYPPVRSRLRVVLNNSAEELEPGRYRFLKPAGWALDPEAGQLRSALPAVVTASLEGPVASRLWRELPERNLTWSELAVWLAAETPGAEGEMEKLLELGFLRCLWPWPAHEAHLEKRLLGFLRSLRDAPLQRVAEPLGRLVDLEEGFPTAADPVGSVQEIERLLDRTWETALELLALGPRIQRPRVQKGEIYEDVLLAPSGTGTREKVFEAPGGYLREAARAVDPVFRLTHLFHPRHDFLYTLKAAMAERWPDRPEVGALELLNAIQPLWRQHARFSASVRGAEGWRETFNPLGLQPLVELAYLRRQVWEEAVASVRSEGGESQICSERLAQALERVPEAYSPRVGPCLLAQPADESGRRWMVNRIFEGTGRYGSRFTPLLDEEARRAYVRHFAARSRVRWRGEDLALLDLLSTHGDTLNVHAPQTHYALETPGEETSGPQRRLRLSDLRVRRHEETGLPTLTDRSGRGYLPVFLGGSSQEFLPVPLKFLSLFGPGEMRPVLPPPRERRQGKATIRERLSLGNAILSRKRWIIDRAALPENLAVSTGAAGLAAIDCWRSAQGIPERVFVIERVSQSPEVYKPQYIDFTSPLFTEIFRSIAQAVPEVIKIEEMMPLVESMPRDGEGRHWGIEILLDSLAFSEPITYSIEHRLSAETAVA